MSYSIDKIEGIGDSYAAKLKNVGVITTTDLLERCRTPQGRKTLANETGLSTKLILRWTNHADLMRISGVGPQWAELLEAAGVDTVKELKNRRADNLSAKMAGVNAERKLVGTDASEKTVAGWVDEARNLDPIVTY